MGKREGRMQSREERDKRENGRAGEEELGVEKGGVGKKGKIQRQSRGEAKSLTETDDKLRNASDKDKLRHKHRQGQKQKECADGKEEQ